MIAYAVFLSKIADYIFFIGLVWFAFFIYGIIRYFRDCDHVTINVAIHLLEYAFLLYVIAVLYPLAKNNGERIGMWVMFGIGVIWNIIELMKAAKKTDEDRRKRGLIK